MGDHVVAPVSELAEHGDRVLVTVGDREIGVFNVDGEYYAYPNSCPHQNGPLCAGPVGGTTEATFDPESLRAEPRWIKEGEILRCPWHNWEFDITENQFRHDTDLSLPSYPVREEDGDVVVSL